MAAEAAGKKFWSYAEKDTDTKRPFYHLNYEVSGSKILDIAKDGHDIRLKIRV